jgi:hypothetical protein
VSDSLRDTINATATLLAGKPDREDGKPYSETFIKGCIDQAFRTVRLKLIERHVAGLRAEVDLTPVTAGTTTVDATSFPSLALMNTPLRLWELVTGQTAWIPMAQVYDHLPFNLAPGAYFRWWEWRGGKIHFIAASASNDIRVHFLSSVADLSNPVDTIGFPDLINPLSYFAASIALGGDADLERLAASDLDSISNIDVHTKQSTPVRRRRRGRNIGRY